MKLNIAIIGTRGIPNQYGGFEQFAEHLSVGLVEKGHTVTVYNSHNHPYQKTEWNGVTIVHCYDPEFKLGSAGQFIYDLNCIRHARKNNFDVLLFLGYSSSSVWGPFYPKKPVIISNMDGLEWKREKYSPPVRRFLKYAEKLAINYSNYFIADSTAIQSHLQERYHINAAYIPYGADILTDKTNDLLSDYAIAEQNYCMLMARMEPENSIETILDGFHQSETSKQFVVVGNTDNRFGKYIAHKFGNDTRIKFLGALFDQQAIHTLKHNSSLYFHGHSVGGTNPSLVEAMSSKALIAAHDNHFNRAVLQKDAYYFTTSAEVRSLVEQIHRDEKTNKMILNNLQKIKEFYNWPGIIEQYENFMLDCFYKHQSVK